MLQHAVNPVFHRHFRVASLNVNVTCAPLQRRGVGALLPRRQGEVRQVEEPGQHDRQHHGAARYLAGGQVQAERAESDRCAGDGPGDELQADRPGGGGGHDGDHGGGDRDEGTLRVGTEVQAPRGGHRDGGIEPEEDRGGVELDDLEHDGDLPVRALR